jgi:Cu-Zn family superoxide dismutase
MNHGCPPNPTRHIGDTGNWNVSTDGTLVATKMLDLISLSGNNSVIGFAIIFHNSTDDCNDTLSSGVRLAQGVIGIANPMYYGGNYSNPTAQATNQYTVTTAICNLRPGNLSMVESAGITGWVRFDQASPNAPTVVTASIQGLVNGTVHGFHVHQYGDLSTIDSLSAFNHFTGPTWSPSSQHGIPGSPFPTHAGDMGNVYFYDVDGIAYYQNTFTNFGLFGAANNIIGRAVILHQLADNCGQPLGNAGYRWAICVIGPANPLYGGNATFPVGLTVPTAQNSTLCTAATTGSVTSGSVTSLPSITSGSLTSGLMPMTTVAAADSSFGVILAVPSILLAFVLSFF